MINATLDDIMGTDITVVKRAKVSYDDDETVEPAGWKHVDLGCVSRDQPELTKKQHALIQYLARGMTSGDHAALLAKIAKTSDLDKTERLMDQYRNTPRHLAPFGHCFATFIVECPVFVARQLVKHEYLRMSEISRRYIKGQPVYYKPKSWRGIAENVKQGSGDWLPQELQDDADSLWQHGVDVSDRMYRAMLQFVSPEEARMMLPLCHMTRFAWSGSMDAFANMCNLRLDSHSQSQTRLVALDVSRQMRKAFPVSWTALVA